MNYKELIENYKDKLNEFENYKVKDEKDGKDYIKLYNELNEDYAKITIKAYTQMNANQRIEFERLNPKYQPKQHAYYIY